MRHNHAISLLGDPKGAMVTHANMISEVSAIQFLLAKVCVMFFCGDGEEVVVMWWW